MNNELSTLKFLPSRHVLVEDEPWHSKCIHKLLIQNFIAYYWIDEPSMTVWVTAIIYGKRDQLAALQRMPTEELEEPMLLLGNLFSLTGALLMVLIGLIKDKKKILLAQCFQFAFLSMANFLLGAFSGMVSNLFGIIRNLAFVKFKATLPLKAGFILLQCFFTVFNRTITPLDLCPLLATVIFISAIDVKKNVHFKIAIIMAQILWLVYDFCYLNYAAFVFDILTIFSNLLSIASILRQEKKAM